MAGFKVIGSTSSLFLSHRTTKVSSLQTHPMGQPTLLIAVIGVTNRPKSSRCKTSSWNKKRELIMCSRQFVDGFLIMRHAFNIKFLEFRK